MTTRLSGSNALRARVPLVGTLSLCCAWGGAAGRSVHSTLTLGKDTVAWQYPPASAFDSGAKVGREYWRGCAEQRCAGRCLGGRHRSEK